MILGDILRRRNRNSFFHLRSHLRSRRRFGGGVYGAEHHSGGWLEGRLPTADIQYFEFSGGTLNVPGGSFGENTFSMGIPDHFLMVLAVPVDGGKTRQLEITALSNLTDSGGTVGLCSGGIWVQWSHIG